MLLQICFGSIVFSASSQESAFGVNCIPIHKRLKCIGFLHMTRHYEPVHEAAKHGGGRVFQSDLIPIMTLFFEITKKNQFKPKIPVSNAS